MSTPQWQQPPGGPRRRASEPSAWPVLPVAEPSDDVAPSGEADANADGAITDEEFRTWQARRGNTPRHIPSTAVASLATGPGEQLRPRRDDGAGGNSWLPISLLAVMAVVFLGAGAVNQLRPPVGPEALVQLGVGTVLAVAAAIVFRLRRRRP